MKQALGKRERGGKSWLGRFARRRANFQTVRPHHSLLYLRTYPVWIVNFEVSNEKEVLEEKIEKKGGRKESAFLYPSSFESWFCWLNKFTEEEEGEIRVGREFLF